MVHSVHRRRIPRIADVRRGLYRVYRIDPRKRHHALAWYFDAVVVALATLAFVLYLAA